MTVPTGQNLLDCLLITAKLEGRPTTAAALTSGLPLEDGQLTPQLFVRACNRAGMAGLLVERTLQSINPAVLPSVLMLEDGKAVVLTELELELGYGVLVSPHEQYQQVSLEDLEKNYSGHLFLLRPMQQFDQRSPKIYQDSDQHWFWGVIKSSSKIYRDVLIADITGADLAADTNVAATIDTTDAAGNSGSANTNQAYTVDTAAPVPTIVVDSITADNIINAAEAGGDVTVTGVVGGEFNTGDTVTLTVNGSDFTGTVDAGGNFSIDITGADLAADTNVAATIDTTDAAGNPGSANTNQAYTVDTAAPVPTIAVDSITADNIINAAEAGGDVTVTGVVGGEFNTGNTVTLTVNGSDFTGTVDAGGNFSIDITGTDLAADTNVAATVDTTDTAGNPGSANTNQGYTVDTAAPVPTINVDSITADNILNAAEAGGDVSVTGTVAGEFNTGDTVTLTVNGNDFTGTVDAGGNFSIDVTGTDLAADTNVAATIDTTDAAGNPGSANTNQAYTVDTLAPTLAITSSDGDLTAAETATITFTFSEVVSDFIDNDITVNGGTLGAISTADGGLTYTAIFTPDTSSGDTATISVLGSDYSDASSNLGADANLNLNLLNTAPVAIDDVATTDEDTVFNSTIDLSANDLDVDSDTLSVVAGTFATTQGGSITIAVDGSYTYTPATNFNGIDTVDYTVTDGELTDVGTLSITINAINDAPENTAPGAQSVDEDTSLAIGGVSVTDVDGNLASAQLSVTNGILTVVLSGAATITAGANDSGTLTIGGSEADINATLANLSYQANDDFSGSDTLTVLSTDGAGIPLSDTDAVAITVNPIADTPNLSVVADVTSLIPADGSASTTTAETQAALEARLGLPVGALDGFNPPGTDPGNVNVVDGGLATYSFELESGGTASFDWSFANGENQQGEINSGYNDIVVLVVTDPNGNITTSIITSSEQAGPSNTVAGTEVVNAALDGQYEISFVILSGRDGGKDSDLSISNVEVTDSSGANVFTEIPLSIGASLKIWMVRNPWLSKSVMCQLGLC